MWHTKMLLSWKLILRFESINTGLLCIASLFVFHTNFEFTFPKVSFPSSFHFLPGKISYVEDKLKDCSWV